MALCDRIHDDIHRVFLNPEHFASQHTWNGKKFTCVADAEEALKRRNNNVVDISWDNNIAEVVLFVKKDEFPAKAQPNDHGLYDGKPVKILDVKEDMGMLEILVTSFNPREG